MPILIIILIKSCAKQSTPMGGPKDEDPPILISTQPLNEATNINPRVIELVFNEYVKLENANKQILITPRINKDEMEVTALRNEVVIKLNQDLEDSTTYVFNFQKSIQDITENNPAENLKLVFSTGPSIDSLQFSGRVSYIFPQRQKVMEDVLVGLYPIGDTTDVLIAPPYYIGQADTLGLFEITNIKAGSYRAYAWHDSNNSLKAEDKSEPYGFLNDTINIEENISGAQFNISNADLTPLQINRSTSLGSNFDVALSKFITDIKVDHPEIHKKLFYRVKEKAIRFYHTDQVENIGDSTAITLSLRDSVGFSLDTVVYAKFEPNERVKEKLETTINTGKNFVNQISSELTFNKPIININLDSLFVKYDTASFIPIQRDWVYMKDSMDFTKLSVDVIIPDSITRDNFVLYAGDSTFYDAEGMVNEKPVEGNYSRLQKSTLADALKVKINTEETPLILQLLNKNGNVVYEQYLISTNEHAFRNIEANTYQVRVIVDLNKNSRWDPSNLLQERQAEPVYYFINPDNDNSRDIVIKGGWEMEITVEPLPKPGIHNQQSESIREPLVPENEDSKENMENDL